MVNFLYQHFIVFIKNQDNIIQLFEKINYTNYTFVVLCDNKEDLSPSSNFAEYIFITNSVNDTILNYCEHKIPNDIILFTNQISCDLLTNLNDIFLKKKPRLVTNSNIYEKSFKTPEYWCCKNYIIRELKKQALNKDLEKTNLLLSSLDISGKENVLVNELFSVKNNILCDDKTKRIRFEPILNTIHIIMATFNRNKNLECILKSLCEQTEKRFCFHLLDNNEDKTKQNEINDIIDKFSDKINISLHRYNHNYHCIARLYIIHNLMLIGAVEYIILFDDDQIHHNYWVENLVKQKSPLSTLSWYGKIFDNGNYWFKGSDYKKILTYTDIERLKRPDINKFKYFGPGGCIFDVNLFLFNELYDFRKYSDLIFKLDDIWLSFVFDKYLNISLNRMIYHPKECIDRNDRENMTWTQCKLDKPLLFNNLSQNYNWNVLENQESCITVNSFFSKIYVLFHNYKKLPFLKKMFSQFNICVTFIFSENRNVTIPKLFVDAIQSSFTSILLLDQNVIFHKFFHYLFDKYIRNLSTNWDILYLGQNIASKDDYGVFTLTSDISNDNTFAAAYNRNAIETILSYTINNKAYVYEENKIMEKTVIQNHYYMYPSLITNNFNNNEDYYVNYNLDIPITVYLFDIDNKPQLYYDFCIIKSIKDISYCETNYFVVINNQSNFYYDKELIVNGLIYLISNNISIHRPKSCDVEEIDLYNYSLWSSYIKIRNVNYVNNNVCFYKKGEQVFLDGFKNSDRYNNVFIF